MSQFIRYTMASDVFVVPREHPEGAWVRWVDVASPIKGIIDNSECKQCKNYDLSQNVYTMECYSCKRYQSDLFTPRMSGSDSL
jgi:hypothetical protein